MTFLHKQIKIANTLPFCTSICQVVSTSCGFTCTMRTTCTCTCTVHVLCTAQSLSTCITLSFSPHHPQVKHLQFVSGVSASSYWLSTFIFDLLNALIPIILTFVLFAVFQIEGYTGENLAALLLLLVCVNIQCTCTCTLTQILTMYMYMYNVYSTCTMYTVHVQCIQYMYMYIDTDTYNVCQCIQYMYIDTDTYNVCVHVQCIQYMYTVCSFCCLFILQLLTNWATIPITYCFSFLFSNALLAFSLMFIVFYFVSLVRNISTCTCIMV